MDKKQALHFLEELEEQGIELGLERIQHFLSILRNPQNSYKVIHIAGTNGKGSTAAMVASILQKAGYNVGMYTSPHLIEFSERIQINGKNIPDEELTGLVQQLKEAKEKQELKLTYFEFTTALAFKHFASHGIDFAVLEVGLGGRLDATNVVKSVVTAITNISFEHENYLGNTLEKIALEKAGIVKEGIPLLTTETNPAVLNILKRVCSGKNSKFVEVKAPYNGKISLQGEFQKINAALAAAIAWELGIEEHAIEQGLQKAIWPGRFEIVSRKPLALFDCAHNTAGMVALREALEKKFPGRKFLLVFGASSDKNIEKMLEIISPAADSVIATAAKHRGTPPEKVASLVKKLGKQCREIADVKEAVKAAMEQSENSVLVCGSCFVIGEAKQLFKG